MAIDESGCEVAALAIKDLIGWEIVVIVLIGNRCDAALLNNDVYQSINVLLFRRYNAHVFYNQVVGSLCMNRVETKQGNGPG